MKRSVLILCGGLALAIGAFGFRGEQAAEDPPFLPINHAEGTKEFRLINAGSDRLDGTADDEVWALRMPAGLWAESLDENRTAYQIKNNPDYPYNLNFSFQVKLPEFLFVKDPFEYKLEERLRVRVSAGNLPYGPGVFAGRIDSTFSTRLDLFANYNCRKDTPVGPGVFPLRQPTDAETAQMAQTYEGELGKSVLRAFLPPECNRPLPFGSQRPTFAVFDENNTAIGYGGCTFDRASNTELLPDDNCSFRFWLPVEREIGMMLAAKHVPHLQDIYTKVATLLRDATDYTNSSNIGDWEDK